MSATNHTSNYNLNQFIGTDKPSWLVDYNGDMLAIDTAMKANQTAAGNAQTKADTADGKADANALAITTLDNQINTPSTGLASVVAGHTTDISGISGKIGTTPLTTVAQTLTGAIEEVKASIPSVSGVLKFEGTQEFTAEADSVKTNAELMTAVYSSMASYISALSTDKRYKVIHASANNNVYGSMIKADNLYNTTPPVISSLDFDIQSTYLNFYEQRFGSVSTLTGFVNGASSDLSSTVPTSGSAVIRIEVYTVVA